jgi:hypothetical protein
MSNTFAQFSLGAEVGLPMGNFGDIAGAGFGGSLRYEANISDKLNWSASAGYLSFSGKTYTYPGTNVTIPFGNFSIIPITGGVKYYFSEVNNGFYGAADLGFNFISTYDVTYNSGNGGGYNLSSASTTKFGLSPGVGYRTGNWDLAARFNLISDANYLGVRVAYVFGTK